MFWWWTLLLMTLLGLSVGTDICPSVCVCSKMENTRDRVKVNCQSKSLTSLPTNLSKQTELLNLNGNKLTALPAESFSDLTELKNLRLRFNDIATVHKDAFKTLKHLRVLMLDYNQIPSLHSDTFKFNEALEIISLSNNPLVKLEDGLFSNKPELASVEVENCGLTYIGTKTFDNVPNLYYLYLNGNKLVNVDFSTLMPLRSLRMILDRNPWKCDCKLRSLRDWMFKEVHASGIEWYKEHSPSCAEPAKLANKTWLDIKSEEFVC
ncbi:phospholipase A2 inhibitor beta-like [Macrosteles quadrilineatus]|uniref:phospholipase A2 inhibitor beta-like n=1 Tax=Macrosteles quadrilineatus TaxID=74068 RepID=UPI0023E17E00|nr:phospholipase A2 inhibitor beta-like [Macrosteles quadrilineatus]